MSTAHVTIFLIVVVSVFCAIDVYLALDKLPDGTPRTGNTYSEIIRNTGNRHPWFRILFIFAWGVLFGHWFW